MINDISTTTIEVKWQWNYIFSRIVENNHQPRLYTQQKYISKMMQSYFQRNKNWVCIIKKSSQMENFLVVLQTGGK